MQAGVELAERYALEELLGYGGMGEVWRGVDRQLDRLVAVKVLRDRHADPELAKRFLREARIAARLQHPGITVVHDVGSHEGQLFIVMELLHGCDLAARLADAPTGLPVDTAVSLAIQAAQALAAAHTVNVIHRDLKPANLFLLTGGQLKICDFGIARVADATSPLTATGQTIGTPAYMSPEQCEGRSVDGRSDLYSLGCVLYALLTGEPPFPAGQPLAVMLHHLKSTPAAPRSLRPEVPAQLDRLVVDLLAKNPADRPPDADHVAATLKVIRNPPGSTVDPAAAPSPASVPRRTPTEIASTVANASHQPITRDGIAKPSPEAGIDIASAKRLISDAEQIARKIHDGKARAGVVGAIAKACAGIDPARAEQIVRAIPDESHRYWPLAVIAKAYARIDPVRAKRLINDAEQIARAIPDNEFNGVFYMKTVATECADIDPARAERLINDAEQMAYAIAREDYRVVALHAVAEAYAGIDPARAEQAARTIPREKYQAWALADSASGYAGIDPAHAERLINDAEQIARTLPDMHKRADALTGVADACADIDPVRAERLINDAEQIARTLPDETDRAWALVKITNALLRKTGRSLTS